MIITKSRLFLILVFLLVFTNSTFCIDYTIEKTDSIISFKAEEIGWEFELEIMEESSNVAAIECVEAFVLAYGMIEEYFPNPESGNLWLNKMRIIVNDLSIPGNEKGELYKEKYLLLSYTEIR